MIFFFWVVIKQKNKQQKFSALDIKESISKIKEIVEKYAPVEESTASNGSSCLVSEKLEELMY